MVNHVVAESEEDIHIEGERMGVHQQRGQDDRQPPYRAKQRTHTVIHSNAIMVS